MKKKKVMMMLATAAVLGALAGCGQTPAAPAEPAGTETQVTENVTESVQTPESETAEAPKEETEVTPAQPEETTVSENAAGAESTADKPAEDPAAIASPQEPEIVDTPATPSIDEPTVGDDGGNGDEDDQGCIGDEGLVW